MAAASLLALLDDIAGILDDVATMTKVATQKTAGVLGDDLALNAQQVSGVQAERELPVVWAVAKGSMINKLILVPLALAVSAWAPWAVTPLLMIGGAYLCFEGVEKLAHRWLHAAPEQHAEAQALHAAHLAALADPTQDVRAIEQDKIKGAIRTDFILSAEIIVIALGTVSTAPFTQRMAVLASVAVLMTVGVYGLVAGIVKLDDAGLRLSRSARSGAQALGRALLWLAPWLMKVLSIVGTAAMFLVGGGILVHGWPAAHHLIETLVPAAGPLGAVVGLVGDAVVGIAAGAVVLAGVAAIRKLRSAR